MIPCEITDWQQRALDAERLLAALVEIRDIHDRFGSRRKEASYAETRQIKNEPELWIRARALVASLHTKSENANV